MGHPALDFRYAQDSNRKFSSPEEEEMVELLQFLEKPQSIGLDNVKQSLRNTVLLMMAMSGLDTGYRYTPIMGDDYGGLSLDGSAEFQRKKKKKKKQLWDQLLEMERLLAEYFDKLFERTLNLITDVKKEINQKIQVLDRMIETNKEDGFFSQEDLRDAKQELRDLKELKTEIEGLETDLKKTNNALDVINIEKKLDDKVSNVQTASPPKKSEFLPLLKASIEKRGKEHIVTAAAAAAAAESVTEAEHHASPSSFSSTETSPSAESTTDTAAEAPTGDSTSASADADTADTAAEAPATDAPTSDATSADAADGDDDASDSPDADADHHAENEAPAPETSLSSDGDAGSDDEGDDGENDEEDDLEPPAPLV